MNTGRDPTNCTLNAEASFTMILSARAWRDRSSWSRAASRSISNDHSYGYVSVAIRSWRSTASQSPGTGASSARSVPTTSPRSSADA